MTRLTQEQMAAFMSQEASSSPLHAFGEANQRVTNSFWNQEEAAFSDATIDFHLLEYYKAGEHRGVFDFGEGRGRTDYLIRTGMVNYFGPDQCVSAEFEGTGQFQQVWIDRSVFRDVASNFAKGDPDHIRLPDFTSIFDPVISHAMTTIMNETSVPSAGGQLMIDAAAQQIAIAILRRNINRPPQRETVRMLSSMELQRAIDFIEDQIEENKGLDALSKNVGMSMYAFAHAFKESVGVSPHQFLIQRRITRAQGLLARGKDTIADIAYACGFSSQAHMTNIFAKHVGISPAKYRKSTRH